MLAVAASVHVAVSIYQRVLPFSVRVLRKLCGASGAEGRLIASAAAAAANGACNLMKTAGFGSLLGRARKGTKTACLERRKSLGPVTSGRALRSPASGGGDSRRMHGAPRWGAHKIQTLSLIGSAPLLIRRVLISSRAAGNRREPGVSVGGRRCWLHFCGCARRGAADFWGWSAQRVRLWGALWRESARR